MKAKKTIKSQIKNLTVLLLFVIVLSTQVKADHGTAAVSDIDHTGMGSFSSSYTHSTKDHVWVVFNANAGNTITFTLSTAFTHHYYLYKANNGCVKTGNSSANGCLTLVQEGGDGATSGTYTYTASSTGQYAFQLDAFLGGSGSYSLGVSGSTATTVLCTAPFITCPSDMTVNTTSGCKAVVNYTAVAAGGNYIHKFSGATIQNGGFGTGSGSAFNLGTTTVTITALANCGSAPTCTFTITVKDATNPVITNCPSNISQGNSEGQCGAFVNWTPPTRTDNCAATLTSTHSPEDFFPLGTTTVTYTATDAANNTATCSFNVTVTDTEKPTIACMSNEPVSTNSGCTYTVSGTGHDPAFTDNCAGASIINNYNNSSTLDNAVFPKGTTTVVWTATDAVNNTETCSVNITVNDNQKPTISCLGDKTRSTNTGVCNYTVSGTEFDPTFADNCSGSSIKNNYNIGSTLANAVFPKGITTVVWTVTDASNNTEICTLFVTVNDAQKPTITCPSDITVGPVTMAGTVVTYTAPVGTDNCTGVSTSRTTGLASGSTFPIGATVVTYTATDASNNSQSCSFTVTVTDPRCTKHKVYVCHSGNTQCVDSNAVSTHLAHGDYLGECDLDKRSNETSKDHADIYPNPTGSQTTVYVNSNTEGTLNLKIISITGQTLFMMEEYGFKGYTEIPLDLSAYATGMYFIHVAYGNKIETFKVQRLN